MFRRTYLLLLGAVLAAATIAVMVASGAALAAEQANEVSDKGDDSNSAIKESTNLTNANDADALSLSATRKKREFARGSGTANGQPFAFDVKAKDTIARTDKAQGNFRVSAGNLFIEGTLSCLRTARTADGSIAEFAGQVTASTIPGIPVDTIFSFNATDASSGDLLSATQVGSATCFPPTGGTIPVDTGNIEIRPLKR